MLRDSAAAKSGSSITARALSLLLDRALNETRPAAVRRAELPTLIEFAATVDLAEVAERFLASGEGATG